MDNNKKKKDYSNLISYLDTNNLKTADIVVTDTVATDDTDNKIDCLLKDINNKFDKSPCNDVSFTGLNYIDELNSINDPNIFQYIDIFNYKSINNSINKGFTVKIATTPQNELIKTTIEAKIESLDDLLKLIQDYPLNDDVEYNIDMKSLHNINDPLKKLNTMIGMKNLKMNIIDQVLYYIQGLHKNGDNISSIDFMHTVIYGPPGTGKTEIAKIMGEIFSKLGILKKGTFKKVTRSDLIAGYLGQTAIKTTEVITECLGGCLFIDEAYALGNTEKKDSFSKECIDTLCEALSNHKEELMVIIAGYERELNECFFSYNRGLESRFTWRFKTDEYTGEQLYEIFVKMVNDCGWTIEDYNDKKDDKKDEDSIINSTWFQNNMVYLKYFGRDIETIFAKTKIAHSRRVFCLAGSEKRIITMKDLESGLALFLENDEVKKRKDDSSINPSLFGLYV